jgi:peptide/nickel transport system substrate-binding protein
MASTPRPLTRRSLLRAAGLAGTGSLLGVPLLSSCADDRSAGGSNGGGGGEVKLATTQIMQFDPYLTNSALHIHAFYTNLIDYAADDDYTPVPAGAEKWQFAPDHRSVTITLRQAAFHSGEPVTAKDVVAGVERALDKEAGFTLNQPSAFIKSAKDLDQRTVRVDFTAPTPEGLVLYWMFAFPLVPAGSNTPKQLETKPAGSGPFRLGSFSKDRSLVLEKNAEYWDKGKPYLDRVEFRFFNDEDSVVAALESGDVDGTAYTELRNAERLRDRFSLVEGGGRMDLFFMNGSRPPFDNKRLRQAVARAIDRERIIKQVRFGMGDPVYTAFMPSSPAFEQDYLDSHGFDLDAARTMLETSGGARSATAGVGTETGAMDILQIIQADLKKIGFDLRIQPREQTAFLDALFASELECAVAAQPNNLQTPSLVSRGRQMLPTAKNVMMRSAVPDRYVAAVKAAQTAIEPEAQKAAYAELNKVLVDEAWAVGIATRPSLFALDKRVNGLVTDPRDSVILTGTQLNQ